MLTKRQNVVERAMRIVNYHGELPAFTKDSIKFALGMVYDVGHWDGQKEVEKKKEIDLLLSDIV